MKKILLLMLVATRALAQSSADKAQADSLFDDGKKALAAGKLAEACEDFEASIKFVPQLGTRLNLADCYSKLGKTASAWAEFREAASLAAKSGDARAQFANDQVAALDKRLDRLTLDVTTVDGEEVKRDGQVVPPVVFGKGVPVDPGEHVVEATAPGRTTFTKKVTIAGEGQAIRVAIPALDKDKDGGAPAVTKLPDPLLHVGPPDRPPARTIERPAGKGTRTAGLVVAGVGVIAAGVGGAFALSASSTWSDGKKDCTGTVCGPTGFHANQDAGKKADLATVFLIAGGVAVAAGVTITLVAPRSHHIAVSLTPTGASMWGRF